ncbi:MAG: hypothetical protein IT376_12665 [Polyangiaceae bacterium]|nr:hypothetical protein [Polyangiaceae bacterium]
MTAGRRPILLCVAGPSGAGKTTSFPIGELGVDSFAVDDRGAALTGSYWAIPPEVRAAVARECEAFVEDRIARGSSFAVETTLRTPAALEQAARARRSGFFTVLCFIGLASPAIGFARVRTRAQAGGHGVPERVAGAIYDASLGHLPRAVRTFERVLLHDGSAPWAPPRLVATARDDALAVEGAPPEWLARALGLAAAAG